MTVGLSQYHKEQKNMAKNVIISGVTYQDVPAVDIPLADQTGNAKFLDTSSANVKASDLRKDVIAYGADGQVVGTLTPAVVSYDSDTKVLSIT